MEMQELSVGHGTLTAVQTGKGADLVVLHSLLADRHAFDPVLPALAARHRVTLFNLPGFHGSQPTLLALMDAYVACIEDGFDELKIGRDAILIGNGFGGTLALAFAFAHPERLSKLVLSDAAASFPPEGRSGLCRDGGEGRSRRAAARSLKSPPNACIRRPILRRIRKRSNNAKLCSWASRRKRSRPPARSCRKRDLTPELGKIKVPTLVVCGEFDQATPPALTKAGGRKIKGARYVELPGCGHCPPLEQPQAFLAAIKDFVGL